MSDSFQKKESIHDVIAEMRRLMRWYTENRASRGLKPGDVDPLFPKLGAE